MARATRYRPLDDPAVQRILAATDEDERKAVEREVVAQSENGPKPTDPKRQPRARRGKSR